MQGSNCILEFLLFLLLYKFIVLARRCYFGPKNEGLARQVSLWKYFLARANKAWAKEVGQKVGKPKHGTFISTTF